MKKFILVALPFIIIGLCIVVIVRNSNTKKEEKTYITEGMLFGMCFGILFGTMFTKFLGLFLSIGMLIGEAIGSCIKRNKGKN